MGHNTGVSSSDYCSDSSMLPVTRMYFARPCSGLPFSCILQNSDRRSLLGHLILAWSGWWLS